MTLPTSDAQSASSLSHLPYRPQRSNSPTHSISDNSFSSHQSPQTMSQTSSSSSSSGARGATSSARHEHALDFATHSWDLATGGLKTLTAKRELPTRADRRISGTVPDAVLPSRGYLLALVILACVVLMLIGSGIVLFVMLLS